jgi:D-alanine--poly(phosphoribitol) ligase subunit 2
MALEPGERKVEPQPAQLMREVSALIREKLLMEVNSPEQDLLDSGVLDSLTLVQLLLNLESRFGVAIPLEELEIDDFRTLSSIVRLIQSRTMVLRTDVAPASGESAGRP